MNLHRKIEILSKALRLKIQIFNNIRLETRYRSGQNRYYAEPRLDPSKNVLAVGVAKATIVGYPISAKALNEPDRC